MQTLRAIIGIAWLIFWGYWLLSAAGAKASVKGRGWLRRPVTGISVLCVFLLTRVIKSGSFVVHSPILGAIGAVVFACGIALAVWARVYLGSNWGMPMSQRVEPELVTSGPYRLVRHPIYSGLLLGLVGTALATNLLGLILVPVLCAYFYFSATVEERNLTATFPTSYPAYRASTKMLIPFVL
jgi:protein-S-isoprenylcysteine O-methyltransferase Ste14